MRAIVAAVLAGAVLAAAAPAGAAPIIERDVPSGARVALGVRATHTRVRYSGGPVLHLSRGHVIFWQPSGSGLAFGPGYMALVDRFLGQVAAASHSTGNVFGLTGQYHDRSGPAAYASTFGGAVLDSDPLPANGCHEPRTAPPWRVCLTDGQLQSEIDRVVAADGLPRRRGDVYFLMTPNGFGDCLDASSTSCALGGAQNGYCGYHLVTGTGIPYAVIPYNAIDGHCQSAVPRPNHSTADPALSTLLHEQSEVITDPRGDAWSAGDGEEIADLCQESFGQRLGGAGGSAWNQVIAGGHYYLQDLWSDADGRCEARAGRDRVSLSGPRRVRVGRRVAFAARAVVPHGHVEAFRWSSGARRERASYLWRRPGRYRVVVRVTDSWGNWAFATRVVRVIAR